MLVVHDNLDYKLSCRHVHIWQCGGLLLDRLRKITGDNHRLLTMKATILIKWRMYTRSGVFDLTDVIIRTSDSFIVHSPRTLDTFDYCNLTAN